ncbi:MAG: flagellar export chaperone FliS [bacterium]|nr:flagellar export chaperone FliS [bacterium]
MVSNPYQKYRQASVETASPTKLVLMLYEGAIKFLNQAKEGLAEKKYDIVSARLIRTQEILNELMISLDMKQGGELAANLNRLYDYMNRRLIDANIKKDREIVEEIQGMFVDLRDTWNEMMKKTGEKVIKKPPPGTYPGA